MTLVVFGYFLYFPYVRISVSRILREDRSGACIVAEIIRSVSLQIFLLGRFQVFAAQRTLADGQTTRSIWQLLFFRSDGRGL